MVGAVRLEADVAKRAPVGRSDQRPSTVISRGLAARTAEGARWLVARHSEEPLAAALIIVDGDRAYLPLTPSSADIRSYRRATLSSRRQSAGRRSQGCPRSDLVGYSMIARQGRRPMGDQPIQARFRVERPPDAIHGHPRTRVLAGDRRGRRDDAAFSGVASPRAEGRRMSRSAKTETVIRSDARRESFYLVNNPPNGGLERQLALLATGLPDGWEPRVWAMGGGPFEDSPPRPGHPGRGALAADPLRPLSGGHRCGTNCGRGGRTSCTAWGWMPALAAGPMCRVLRIPCVDGMIRSGALEPDFTRLKRLGMACATLVVANTSRPAGVECQARQRARRLQRLRRRHASRRRCRPARRTGAFHGGHDRPNDAGQAVRPRHRRRATPQHASDGWRFLLVGDGPDRERLLRQRGGPGRARRRRLPGAGDGESSAWCAMPMSAS